MNKITIRKHKHKTRAGNTNETSQANI